MLRDGNPEIFSRSMWRCDMRHGVMVGGVSVRVVLASSECWSEGAVTGSRERPQTPGMEIAVFVASST